jgi:transcriptional regulator GlxA family with amidase domain
METINAQDWTENDNIGNTRRIEELRHWVISHLDDRHSLRSLADHSAMSVSKMQRAFRDAYGCSVFAYIRIERLLRAQKQLEVTTMNIKSISAGAGYRSVPAFTAAFSVAFGETPARFRRGIK